MRGVQSYPPAPVSRIPRCRENDAARLPVARLLDCHDPAGALQLVRRVEVRGALSLVDDEAAARRDRLAVARQEDEVVAVVRKLWKAVGDDPHRPVAARVAL